MLGLLFWLLTDVICHGPIETIPPVMSTFTLLLSMGSNQTHEEGLN
jgi:hypothetical protein